MVYVIEFQKKGLPHCHMFLVLNHYSKLRDNHDIDNIICAKIPEETKEPKLPNYQIMYDPWAMWHS